MWKAQAPLSLSHCGPILTFMMKIWRDTREGHHVKFLSVPLIQLMMSKAMLFALLTFMPHARVPVLCHRSGEHKPESQSGLCPLSAYHPV